MNFEIFKNHSIQAFKNVAGEFTCFETASLWLPGF
jgi:hypothetical protein